ncbi:MAG: 23S rRNA (guanosine(2251)-2'-O)-methyltransferase RlmB [Acidobacteriota bacterium]
MTDQFEEEILYGINPLHEALHSGKVEIEKIFISKGGAEGKVGALMRMARQRGIPVSNVPVGMLRRMSGTDKHQGIVATIAASRYSSRQEIFQFIDDRSIVLILDGIEDPGNFGAIVRTAVATSVAGIFIPIKRSVGMTKVAAKRSAGSIVHARISREKSLVSLAEALKEKGFHIVAVEKDGKEDFYDFLFEFPLALILGSESSGITTELMSRTDASIRIPISEQAESLNVSVACGVILYEVMRRSITKK